MKRGKNPWHTLESKLIYQNKWLSLVENKVITPCGEEGIYSVVNTSLAVGVLALDGNDIVLIGQYRYPTNIYSWEIIAGGAQKGESGLEAAKRELKEEAGITAKKWHLLASNIQMANCFSSEIGEIYLAMELTYGETSPDDTEELTVKKVYFQEALSYVLTGEITDDFSMLGILILDKKRKELNLQI